MTALRIGTRGSPLALWQATFVAQQLRALARPRPVELVEIQTSGDRHRHAPLAQIGGDGVFTKEIQRALQVGEVDVAVHSLKDLPTAAVDGLALAAVPTRGPVEDVLVSSRHRGFDALPQGARVGTSSLRRRAQVLNRRPDLKLVDLRGNVETRLQKLTAQQLDGIILARAGLERLGLGNRITEVLEWMLPAIGQGALGLECRADDPKTCAVVVQLDDRSTRQCVLTERALLRELGGGCLVPIGAASVITGTSLLLRAAVLSSDGGQRIEADISGSLNDGEHLGVQLARELLKGGAGKLLAVR
jgi:hydroxymethylbilane synthase